MMEMVRKMDSMLIGAKIRVQKFFENEEGDTNFISILVILGIALALAATFMYYKDKIMDNVTTDTNKYFNYKKGQNPNGV